MERPVSEWHSQSTIFLLASFTLVQVANRADYRPMDTKQLLESPIHMSLREAAKYLRVARRTLQHAIEDGELQAFRIGARRLTVRRGDLDAWLSSFLVGHSNPKPIRASPSAPCKQARRNTP